MLRTPAVLESGLSSWDSEHPIEDAAPFAFSSTNVGAPQNVQFQPNADINVYPNHHPTPGFFEGENGIVTQPLISHNDNVIFENFQPEDFNAALTSTVTDFDFPSLGLGNASASGFQTHGSQNAWDQTATQDDSVAVFSWGQSMNVPPFNGAFQPSNADGGFVDTDFGLSMPWSPATSMEGDFQQGVGSNVAAASTQWHDDNMTWDPAPSTAPSTASSSQQTPSPNPPLPTHLPGPSPQAPAPTRQRPNARIACTYPPCTKTFRRDYERIRHENSKHVNIQGTHLCPITGCSKNQGKGYSRSDKVTEHLWKKHANLGYTKA